MKDMLSDICSFFILHPSAFILAFGGRCGSRTHRSVSAPTVFGTAWRARAQPSFVLAGALGFKPRKAGLESASLTFSLRPLRCIREDSNLQRSLRSHSFTGCCRADSASDARFDDGRIFENDSERKFDEGGERVRAA